MRNVTSIVDDGRQADRGRKTRLNDVDGLTRCVKSAGRIERLLRNKRSFGELWNHKGECQIPCDKQLCSFPTLSEQESGQTRQMDRGEIEVEEERRVRTKCMPVLPTDSEKHESKSTHVASRGQYKTEDSRKHLEIVSSLPRVAMDRGFLARSTDADLVTNTMLIQKPYSAAEARQVSHEAPEPRAVNCVLENLDANGLGREYFSKKMLGLPPRQSLTQFGSVRSVCISQVVRVRLMRERSRVRRRPMIPCCQRSSDAEPTARALFRRGSLDVRRTCTVGPRSIKTCALGRG